MKISRKNEIVYSSQILRIEGRDTSKLWRPDLPESFDVFVPEQPFGVELATTFILEQKKGRVDNKKMQRLQYFIPIVTEDLGVFVTLLLIGLVQLVLFGRNRRPAHGSLALLCAGMLVGWIVNAGIWPLALHFQAVILAAIVPLLLFYLQTLIPRRWLAGMVDFTWAYVIPYVVIVFVYPPEQLVPILPVMEKLSFFSLATTLIAAYQAREEGQRYAGMLLFTLVLLFVGLVFAPTRAWALGLFVGSQAWIVARAVETRP
ncbi:MAG TPA: hypothetical protein VFO10_18705 [Oligoflexus sp.]|uniref:hypothetical protein n=1 Tax=Oligoflexus sp. TaxID=1971216 RepID=UPI002D80440C|nr:hypothetical protein [Oligoflexus sp.]HET9239298.1 hypothetical protein [Oligoflexus sp.]